MDYRVVFGLFCARLLDDDAWVGSGSGARLMQGIQIQVGPAYWSRDRSFIFGPPTVTFSDVDVKNTTLGG